MPGTNPELLFKYLTEVGVMDGMSYETFKSDMLGSPDGLEYLYKYMVKNAGEQDVFPDFVNKYTQFAPEAVDTAEVTLDPTQDEAETQEAFPELGKSTAVNAASTDSSSEDTSSESLTDRVTKAAGESNKARMAMHAAPKQEEEDSKLEPSAQQPVFSLTEQIDLGNEIADLEEQLKEIPFGGEGEQELMAAIEAKRSIRDQTKEDVMSRDMAKKYAIDQKAQTMQLRNTTALTAHLKDGTISFEDSIEYEKQNAAAIEEARIAELRSGFDDETLKSFSAVEEIIRDTNNFSSVKLGNATEPEGVSRMLGETLGLLDQRNYKESEKLNLLPEIQAEIANSLSKYSRGKAHKGTMPLSEKNEIVKNARATVLERKINELGREITESADKKGAELKGLEKELLTLKELAEGAKDEATFEKYKEAYNSKLDYARTIEGELKQYEGEYKEAIDELQGIYGFEKGKGMREAFQVSSIIAQKRIDNKGTAGNLAGSWLESGLKTFQQAAYAGAGTALGMFGDLFTSGEEYSVYDAWNDTLFNSSNIDFFQVASSEMIDKETGEWSSDPMEYGTGFAEMVNFTLGIIHETRKGQFGSLTKATGKILGRNKNIVGKFGTLTPQLKNNIIMADVTYRMTIADNLNEAKANGLDGADAFAYANLKSIGTAVTQAVMPDNLLVNNNASQLFKKLAGSLKNASSRQATKEASKQFIVNLGKEFVEEDLDYAWGEIVDMTFGLAQDKELSDYIREQKEVAAGVLTLSGPLGGYGAYKTKKGLSDMLLNKFAVEGVESLQYLQTLAAEAQKNGNIKEFKKLEKAFRYGQDLIQMAQMDPSVVTIEQLDLLIQKRDLEEEYKGLEGDAALKVEDKLTVLDNNIAAKADEMQRRKIAADLTSARNIAKQTGAFSVVEAKDEADANKKLRGMINPETGEKYTRAEIRHLAKTSMGIEYTNAEGQLSILVNKSFAKATGYTTTGQHEVLHIVLKKAMQANPELAEVLGKALIAELDVLQRNGGYIGDGYISRVKDYRDDADKNLAHIAKNTSKEIARLRAKANNENTTYTEAEYQRDLTAITEQATLLEAEQEAIFNEELITLLSESLSRSEVTNIMQAPKGFGAKLANAMNEFAINAGIKDIDLSSGDGKMGVYNFIQRYNKEFAKGKLSRGTKRLLSSGTNFKLSPKAAKGMTTAKAASGINKASTIKKSLKTKMDLDWEDSKNGLYRTPKFKVGDMDYDILLSDRRGGVFGGTINDYDVQFYAYEPGTYFPTQRLIGDTRKVFTAFAVIKNAIVDKLESLNANSVSFNAKNEGKRVRLYEAIALNAAKDLGWDLKVNDGDFGDFSFALEGLDDVLTETEDFYSGNSHTEFVVTKNPALRGLKQSKMPADVVMKVMEDASNRDIDLHDFTNSAYDKYSQYDKKEGEWILGFIADAWGNAVIKRMKKGNYGSYLDSIGPDAAREFAKKVTSGEGSQSITGLIKSFKPGTAVVIEGKEGEANEGKTVSLAGWINKYIDNKINYWFKREEGIEEDKENTEEIELQEEIDKAIADGEYERAEYLKEDLEIMKKANQSQLKSFSTSSIDSDSNFEQLADSDSLSDFDFDTNVTDEEAVRMYKGFLSRFENGAQMEKYWEKYRAKLESEIVDGIYEAVQYLYADRGPNVTKDPFAVRLKQYLKNKEANDGSLARVMERYGVQDFLLDNLDVMVNRFELAAFSKLGPMLRVVERQLKADDTWMKPTLDKGKYKYIDATGKEIPLRTKDYFKREKTAAGPYIRRRIKNAVNLPGFKNEVVDYVFDKGMDKKPAKRKVVGIASEIASELGLEMIMTDIQTPGTVIYDAMEDAMQDLSIEQDTDSDSKEDVGRIARAEMAKQAVTKGLTTGVTNSILEGLERKAFKQSRVAESIADMNSDIQNGFFERGYGKVRQSRKHQQDYKNKLVKKRPDLTPEQIENSVESIFTWVEGIGIRQELQKKHESLALHYMANAYLILPEDGYKVEEAIRLAKIKKIDPFSYMNPADLIADFADKVKAKRINPDREWQLSNKQEHEGGITTYDVDGSQEGQEAMRLLLDNHRGKTFNEWCLLARLAERHIVTEDTKEKHDEVVRKNLADGYTVKEVREPYEYDGIFYYETVMEKKGTNLREELKIANGYWNDYQADGNGLKVAFKNGKLTWFRDGKKASQWWDPRDQPTSTLEKRTKVVDKGVTTETVQDILKPELKPTIFKSTGNFKNGDISFKELVVDSNVLESFDDMFTVLPSGAEISGNVKISGYDSSTPSGPITKAQPISGEFNVSYKPEETITVLDQNWRTRSTDGISLSLNNITEDVLTFKGLDASRTISGKFKEGENVDYQSFYGLKEGDDLTIHLKVLGLRDIYMLGIEEEWVEQGSKSIYSAIFENQLLYIPNGIMETMLSSSRMLGSSSEGDGFSEVGITINGMSISEFEASKGKPTNISEDLLDTKVQLAELIAAKQEANANGDTFLLETIEDQIVNLEDKLAAIGDITDEDWAISEDEYGYEDFYDDGAYRQSKTASWTPSIDDKRVLQAYEALRPAIKEFDAYLAGSSRVFATPENFEKRFKMWMTQTKPDVRVQAREALRTIKEYGKKTDLIGAWASSGTTSYPSYLNSRTPRAQLISHIFGDTPDNMRRSKRRSREKWLEGDIDPDLLEMDMVMGSPKQSKASVGKTGFPWFDKPRIALTNYLKNAGSERAQQLVDGAWGTPEYERLVEDMEDAFDRYLTMMGESDVWEEAQQKYKDQFEDKDFSNFNEFFTDLATQASLSVENALDLPVGYAEFGKNSEGRQKLAKKDGVTNYISDMLGNIEKDSREATFAVVIKQLLGATAASEGQGLYVNTLGFWNEVVLPTIKKYKFNNTNFKLIDVVDGQSIAYKGAEDIKHVKITSDLTKGTFSKDVFATVNDLEPALATVPNNIDTEARIAEAEEATDLFMVYTDWLHENHKTMRPTSVAMMLNSMFSKLRAIGSHMQPITSAVFTKQNVLINDYTTISTIPADFIKAAAMDYINATGKDVGNKRDALKNIIRQGETAVLPAFYANVIRQIHPRTPRPGFITPQVAKKLVQMGLPELKLTDLTTAEDITVIDLQEATSIRDYKNKIGAAKQSRLAPTQSINIEYADDVLNGKLQANENTMLITTDNPVDVVEELMEDGININTEQITQISEDMGEAVLTIALQSQGYNNITGVKFSKKPGVNPLLEAGNKASDLNKKKQERAKGLNRRIQEIIERKKGIKADDKVWAVEATGTSRDLFTNLFISTGADDFQGLLYRLLPSAKKGGEADWQWMVDTLVDPYTEGVNALDKYNVQVGEKYKELKRKYKDIFGKLGDNLPGTSFTYDQAIRYAVYSRDADNIPKLQLAVGPNMELRIKSEMRRKGNEDLNNLVEDIVNILNTSSTGSFDINMEENWFKRSIATEFMSLVSTSHRKASLTEWIDNVDTVFNDDVLNKLEKAYGTKYREALVGAIKRMKMGTKAAMGMTKIDRSAMNWVNGAVMPIMFLNFKSGWLQLLSFTNFINTSDNNILKATGTLFRPKRFIKDFGTIFKSDKLVQRRAGLRMSIEESEIANMTGKNEFLNWMRFKAVQVGFAPTKLMDSVAIALGGASFYRNRINTYKKEGKSVAEAEKLAFKDLAKTSDQAQQSSDQMFISAEQASEFGRIIMAFANTPAQYARMTKKAGLDLINGRGNTANNIAKIIYYMGVQNVTFSLLQNWAMGLWFDDEEWLLTDSQIEEMERKIKAEKNRGKKAKMQGTLDALVMKSKTRTDKKARVVNSVIDSILRGMGYAGAGISTVKNIALAWKKEADSKLGTGANIAIAASGISPVLSAKVRDVKRIYDIEKYSGDVIDHFGVSIRSPRINQVGIGLRVLLNSPTLEYTKRKLDQFTTTLKSDEATFKEKAAVIIGGYSPYSLEIIDREIEQINEDADLLRELDKAVIKELEKEAKALGEAVRQMNLTPEERKAEFAAAKAQLRVWAKKAAATRARNKQARIDSYKNR